METSDEKKNPPKDRVKYLWFDIDEITRTRLLNQARLKLAKGGADVARKIARIDAIEKRNREPRKGSNFTSLSSFVSNFVHDEDFTFDDGWYRLVVKTRNDGLEIFNGERYESAELPNLTKVGREIQRMCKYPKGRPGGKKKNPFRQTWVTEVAIVLVQWVEESAQYCIEVGGVTYWFPESFKQSNMGPEWFKVRNFAKGQPWASPLESPSMKLPTHIDLPERCKEILREAVRVEDKNDRSDLKFQVQLYLRRMNPTIPPRLIVERVEGFMKMIS